MLIANPLFAPVLALFRAAEAARARLAAIERRIAASERNIAALAHRAEHVARVALSRSAGVSHVLATTAAHWLAPNASAAHSCGHGGDGDDDSDGEPDALAAPADSLALSFGGAA